MKERIDERADLVSRQAAIDTAERMYGCCDTGSINDYHDLMVEALSVLPSAQPEIIKCKDCVKHETCRTTNIWAIAPDDDWFCADAERRTDETANQ